MKSISPTVSLWLTTVPTSTWTSPSRNSSQSVVTDFGRNIRINWR